MRQPQPPAVARRVRTRSQHPTTINPQGRANLKQLAKSWSVSYIGNIIGMALFVGAVAYSGVIAGAAMPQVGGWAAGAAYETTHYLAAFHKFNLTQSTAAAVPVRDSCSRSCSWSFSPL